MKSKKKSLLACPDGFNQGGGWPEVIPHAGREVFTSSVDLEEHPFASSGNNRTIHLSSRGDYRCFLISNSD